jgi:hypothetical protein
VLPAATTSGGLGSLQSTYSGLQSSLTNLFSGLQSQAGKPVSAQEALALQIFATYPTNPGTQTGYYLATLTPNAAWTAHGMIAQVNQLATDQQQLTNDINNGATVGQVTSDYARASNLYGQIQAENSSIQSQTQVDEQILTWAQQQPGMLNSTDMMQVTYALNQISRASQVATFELGQANNVVNTQEPFGFSSIAQASA